MHFSKVWDYLRNLSNTKQNLRPRGRRIRPMVELLEDRSLMTTGSITGTVFVNSLSHPLAGASIVLTGTPTATPTDPVNLSAQTDANGAFTFSGLPLGSYHLTTGPFTGLDGTVTIGGVSSSA